jgi:hypothetical protein
LFTFFLYSIFGIVAFNGFILRDRLFVRRFFRPAVAGFPGIQIRVTVGAFTVITHLRNLPGSWL